MRFGEIFFSLLKYKTTMGGGLMQLVKKWPVKVIYFLKNNFKK